MVTYHLDIADLDIWFVQTVLDEANNLCIIDRTSMVGKRGVMIVHLSDEAEPDFLDLLERIRNTSDVTFERA